MRNITADGRRRCRSPDMLNMCRSYYPTCISQGALDVKARYRDARSPGFRMEVSLSARPPKLEMTLLGDTELPLTKWALDDKYISFMENRLSGLKWCADDMISGPNGKSECERVSESVEGKCKKGRFAFTPRSLTKLPSSSKSFLLPWTTSATTTIMALQQSSTMDLRAQILGNSNSLLKTKPQQLIDDRELALRPARPC